MRARFVLGALLLAAACGGGGETGDAGATVDGGMVPAADAAAPPADCDPLRQSGCAGDDKCTLVPDEGSGPPRVICAPPGDKGLDESCAPATPEQPDDCAAGLFCSGTANPHCVEFCADGTNNTCADGYTCAISVDVDATVGTVWLCAHMCDPLAQDCPDAEEACYPSLGGTVCAPTGAGGEPVDEGGLCPYANSCARGLGCFRLGDALEFTCQRICDPYEGDAGCAPAQTCSLVEDKQWGICIDEA